MVDVMPAVPSSTHSLRLHALTERRHGGILLHNGSGVGRSGLPVVLHVRSHEVIGRQGSHQTQLARKHGGPNDAGQLSGVVSWAGVGTLRSATHTSGDVDAK